MTGNTMTKRAAQQRFPEVRRSRRHRQVRLTLLVAPLFFFTLAGFVMPLSVMLQRSVDNSLLQSFLTQTAVALDNWDGTELPGALAFEAIVVDINDARKIRRHALFAKHINYEEEGLRSLIMRSARHAVIKKGSVDPSQLLEVDPRWGEISTWKIIQRATSPISARNLLAALDLRLNANGDIVRVEPGLRIHNSLLVRSIGIAVLVTILCLVIGFPIAMMLASTSGYLRNVLLVCVVLPFWTSILIRTTAWIVLLQREGVVNDLLIALGITDDPVRLMFSRTGVLVAMTHVLLPFMILPIYSTMKSFPIGYLRASLSLGASPLRTFIKVFLPLVSPGVNSGCVLVFVLALGFYITPALVGGASDQMYSYVIAYHTTTSLNWGLAAALSLVLLVCVCVLYFILTRLLGSARLSVGVGR